MKNPKIEQKSPCYTENTTNGENENTSVLTIVEKNILRLVTYVRVTDWPNRIWKSGAQWWVIVKSNCNC